ncbi:MAG: DNA polymerase III subunit gamma/tau [Patescibacteria group bacterium]
MSEVFYRKYRPKKFEEVAGQAHVLQILKNAVKNNNVAHAYLFSGPHGTGKTTLARILATSVGCKSEDTLEIDAASQRGIDEARALREGVRVLPFNSPKKAYIIDEVHMLTREAFNALLKTLEEPPEHAIFILCTTEIQKVPDTIISRTQHFKFNKISASDTAFELKKIAKKENLEIEDGALRIIAFFADGSLRDAQNILFQAANLNKKITEEDLRLLLGVPPQELVNSITSVLFLKDPKTLLELFDKAFKNGGNHYMLARLILRNIRAAYFLHLNSSAKILGNEFSEENIKFLSAAANSAGGAKFFDFAIKEILFSLEQKTDDYTAHIPLELALIKIATQTSQ